MSERIDLDLKQCDDCKRPFKLWLLDGVLLDNEGAMASTALYCQHCWPRHKIVAWDQWREGPKP